MTLRRILLNSAAVAPLLMVVPEREPSGWYGAIDAGYHMIGDFRGFNHDR